MSLLPFERKECSVDAWTDVRRESAGRQRWNQTGNKLWHSMPTFSLPSFTFRNALALSAFLRVALICYSEWHDARSQVKYTDVDYRVFSDAAAFVLDASSGAAQGPLKDLGYDFKFGRYASWLRMRWCLA